MALTKKQSEGNHAMNEKKKEYFHSKKNHKEIVQWMRKKWCDEEKILDVNTIHFVGDYVFFFKKVCDSFLFFLK